MFEKLSSVLSPTMALEYCLNHGNCSTFNWLRKRISTFLSRTQQRYVGLGKKFVQIISFIVPDEYQDEFLELKTNLCAKDMFNDKSLAEFWPLMINTYPNVTENALRTLMYWSIFVNQAFLYFS